MSEIFAIRNVDEKTRTFIQDYAHEHNLNLGEALRQIVFLVREHFSCLEKKKKYKSLFDTYEELKFNSGDPNLSKNIDKILYGKRG